MFWNGNGNNVFLFVGGVPWNRNKNLNIPSSSHFSIPHHDFSFETFGIEFKSFQSETNHHPYGSSTWKGIAEKAAHTSAIKLHRETANYRLIKDLSPRGPSVLPRYSRVSSFASLVLRHMGLLRLYSLWKTSRMRGKPSGIQQRIGEMANISMRSSKSRGAIYCNLRG